MKLVLFGNAILDIGKRVSHQDLHRKYNLKLDDQLEPDSHLLHAIKKDLDEVYVDLIGPREHPLIPILYIYIFIEIL